MVFVFLAEGFEEIEAATAIDILRRADVVVTTVSIEPTLAVKGAHGVTFVADVLFDEADFVGAQALVLPGGRGYLRLLAHKGLAALLKNAAETPAGAGTNPASSPTSPPLLAAICAAPAVFAQHGLLNGRQATIFPGMEDELSAGGATPIPEPVAVDGRFVTSRSPGTALPFALKLVELLAGPATAETIEASLHIP
jgi:4-methyl-5(b-hydroxyethyl)-thiazole monophosphate biosynthesis